MEDENQVKHDNYDSHSAPIVPFDIIDSPMDDSLYIASKHWNRLVDNAVKGGYREGIQDGEDSVLQKGFDIGFKNGFENAFALGKCQGWFAASKSIKQSNVEEIDDLFSKMKHDACWICYLKSQGKPPGSFNNYETIPFSEVLKEQRAHFTAAISTLQNYCCSESL